MMSGGIGDFLHYISLFDALLARSNANSHGIRVFVESTRPAEVKSLFDVCMGDVDVQYIPSHLHWTKTNPLLDPYSARDRAQRPARLYLDRLGYSSVEDWFLPFLVSGYPKSLERFKAFTTNSSQRRFILVSARNKGFPWWLDESSAEILGAALRGRFDLIEIGTPDELTGRFGTRFCANNTAEGLKLACSARLLVGTDTGFATLRELLNLPNVYCVSAYWKDRFMQRLGYWNESMALTSKSRFAYDRIQLMAALSELIDADVLSQPESSLRDDLTGECDPARQGMRRSPVTSSIAQDG